jgi:hypothetical protein
MVVMGTILLSIIHLFYVSSTGQQWLIIKEIFQVAGTGLTASADAACYLIKIGTEAALIDAGSGQAISNMLARIKRARSTRQRSAASS